ncbi:MAG: flagellar biosynthetic protein FliO [Chromatiaceae bacterium]|nr:flagellar biosynthetic protein FliO [Gammaproteobacteria bacterium]MCP5305699.1 flagellar biosynthetic protein FliO [Chromatiaceae bacterium]MCP5312556.1 flagellar biosynthetic protein FliO [Chromatiaceae bacterium]
MHYLLLIAVPLASFAQASGAAPGEVSSRLAETPLSSANLIDTGLGLVVVLAVMLALAWLVKRFVHTPGIAKGHVQVLGGVSLGAREKAVLLSVEGRRLLVGVAPGRVQTLLLLGDTEPDEATFDAHLRQAAQSPQVDHPEVAQ